MMINTYGGDSVGCSLEGSSVPITIGTRHQVFGFLDDDASPACTANRVLGFTFSGNIRLKKVAVKSYFFSFDL